MDITVTDRVLELLAEKAALPVAELDPGKSLEEVGLDSLHLMEVALWMQHEYGVVVNEGELHYEQTVREALEFLERRTR